jgi:hypothetical protein
MVYRRSTHRNGTILHIEKKDEVKKKFKGCTSLNRDSARVFYTRHCRQTVQDFYANSFTLKALDN